MERRAAWGLAYLLLVLATTACSGADDEDREPQPVWTEHELPAPVGSPGRTVVRDAVECGDGWWVAGAVLLDSPTETRDTRPALWFSADRDTWSSVEVRAATYWGRRAIINSIACSDARIAAVGARSGGAHGNPRVTTFHLDDEQERLVDVRTTFIQYGGVTATNVGPVAGGPAGWLIAGNRTSGPGVWVTDDPRGFTRVEAEPGLTDDGDLESLAQAGGWAGDEWVVVGAGSRPGQALDRDPLAWTSPDGLHWTPQQMPAGDDSEDVHRVTQLPDGRLLAVGRSGNAYAAWVRDDDGWGEAALFGSVAKSWRGAPYVASLAPVGDEVLATLSTGDHYELWRTSDGTGWSRLDVPLTPDTAGDHTMAVAGGDDLLLLVDGGSEGGGGVWSGMQPSS